MDEYGSWHDLSTDEDAVEDGLSDEDTAPQSHGDTPDESVFDLILDMLFTVSFAVSGALYLIDHL